MSKEARCDWGRIIRNKCITVERRLERRLKRNKLISDQDVQDVRLLSQNP